MRGKIVLAFLCLSLITALFGVQAVRSIRGAGVLVADIFDRALMSTSFARAAATDFAEMQAAFLRAPDAEREAQIASAAAALADDLRIAAERAATPAAAKVAAAAWEASQTWLRAGTERSAGLPLDGLVLDGLAADVGEQIDTLVNLTAGAAFRQREQALASIAEMHLLLAAGAVLAVMVAGLVTWVLLRAIIGPLAAASAAAGRIAAGKLDTAIPAGGRDELGALLAAMAVMRDRIAAMMQREIARGRSAQMRMVDAIESSGEGVILVEAGGTIAVANTQAGAFLPRALTGNRFDDAIGANIAARLAAGGSPLEERQADGRWLRIGRNPAQDGGFVISFSDITVLKQREAELRHLNGQFDAALTHMSQGLCLWDVDARLRVVNTRFCEIYNLPSHAVTPGMALADLLAQLDVNGAGFAAAGHALAGAPRDVTADRFLHRLTDGRFVAVAREPMADGGWVFTYDDITDRRRAEARVLHMSRHDSLTGLPNRTTFDEHMQTALAQAGRHVQCAVLCLDVDHLRDINEALGRQFGDEILRQIALRLQACVREVDTVARLDSDAFAIIQTGIERAEDVEVLARRILEIAAVPCELDGRRADIGITIGIALAPGDGTGTDSLLKCADLALSRAKTEGRGSYRFFEPEMDARLQQRRALEHDLREAVAADQFELYFQPLYNLARDGVTGFEALLRWQHPTRGRVSPAEFIPVAEDLGLITQLGAWVLAKACQHARAWPEHVKVAVNVSPLQFAGPSLYDHVAGALAASGLQPARLELEITESVLLGDSARILALLHRIKALGVGIAMDDFGTGYSSLSYLRSFPFDKIKIDQSFIRDLAETAESRAIVRAITGLGNSLGMRITAEGVETQAQLDLLRAEHCTEIQGYYFSPPRPAAEVPAMIQRWMVREDGVPVRMAALAG